MSFFIAPRQVVLMAVLGALYSCASQAESHSLASLQKLMKSAKEVSGQFEQEKVLKKMGFALKSKGTFLQKQSQVRWVQTDPIAVTYVLSPKGVVEEVNGNTKVLAGTQLGVAGFNQIMGCLLQIDRMCLQKHFKISEETSSKKSWSLELEPKNSLFKKAVEKIRLVGNARNIEELKIIESPDSYLNIRFLNVVYQGAPK